MLAILLLLALILPSFTLYERLKSIRESLIWSLLIFGVTLTIITEGLSLINAFNRTGLVLTWGAVVLVWMWVILQQDNLERPHLRLTRDLWILVALIGVITSLTLLVALIAPPNTWDSMTYHMTRVVYWQEFESVKHFSVQDDRLLFNPPFAEFAIAHLQILSGGDRFANLPQWFAMLHSLVAVTLILREWGVNKIAKQFIAAIVLVTLPMGIMQSSSTQNDYVAAVWVIILAWFVVRAVRSQHVDFSIMIGIGISSGLAVLTKGTGYVYILPLLIWFGSDYLFKHRSQVWKPICIIGVIALLLNMGHYSRNYAEYGSPIAPTDRQSSHSNETLSIPTMLSVASRNMALNIYPNNDAVMDVLLGFHDLIGVPIDDPGSSYLNNRFELPALWKVFHEDFGANPLHLLLLVGTSGYVLIAGRRLRMYWLVIIAQFLLMALLFRWQPWGLRLQLGFWVVAAPLIGYTLVSINWNIIRYVIIAILVGVSLFWVMNTSSRPLLQSDLSFFLQVDVEPFDRSYSSILNEDRFGAYFYPRLELEEPFREAVAFLADDDCHQIGMINPGDWEYPLLYTLTQDGRQVRQIMTGNTTHQNTFSPCTIVSLGRTPNQLDWLGQTFILTFQNLPLQVYQPTGITLAPYQNEDYSINIYPQEYGGFHVYADCVNGNCQLVSVIEGLSPDSTQQFGQEWLTEVEYLTTEETFEIYQVRVFDTAGELQDEVMQIMLSPTRITWRRN